MILEARMHRHTAKVSLGFVCQGGRERSNHVAAASNCHVYPHRAQPIPKRLEIRNRISERVRSILIAVLLESCTKACQYVAGILRLRSTNTKTRPDHFQTCRAAVYHAY